MDSSLQAEWGGGGDIVLISLTNGSFIWNEFQIYAIWDEGALPRSMRTFAVGGGLRAKHRCSQTGRGKSDVRALCLSVWFGRLQNKEKYKWQDYAPTVE